MKIAFVGNQDNNAYRLCKWMRQMGIESDVYRLEEEYSARSLPENVDPELAQGAPKPDWLRFLDGVPRELNWYTILNPMKTHKTEWIDSNYDIIVTAGFIGIHFARMFTKTPVVILSLGSEVTDLPYRLFRKESDSLERHRAVSARLALSHASAIVTSYSRTVLTLAELGHRHKTRLWGYPEDLEQNHSRVDQSLLAELNSKYRQYDAVYLWFSRLNYLDPTSDEYKGPERFLAAYEQVVKANRPNVRAIMGQHGTDHEAFMQLVRDKGLESHIDFVPHLPYYQLLTHLSISNGLVFDLLDVEKGTPGGLVRESLSIGANLAMAIDRDSMDAFYGPDCPIFDAPTAQECYHVMLRWLSMSDQEREDYQANCASWTKRSLGVENAVSSFMQMLHQTRYCWNVEQKFKVWESRDIASELHVSPLTDFDQKQYSRDAA